MAKKNQPYKHLPLYIVIKPNCRPFNSKTGTYLSDKEIDAYREPKSVKQEHKLSHDQIIEKRWDLRID